MKQTFKETRLAEFKTKIFQKWSNNFRQEDLVILDGISNDFEQFLSDTIDMAESEINLVILELVKLRTWLVKEIDGNQANIIMKQKYNQPQIDKIDELIKSLSPKD